MNGALLRKKILRRVKIMNDELIFERLLRLTINNYFIVSSYTSGLSIKVKTMTLLRKSLPTNSGNHKRVQKFFVGLRGQSIADFIIFV